MVKGRMALVDALVDADGVGPGRGQPGQIYVFRGAKTAEPMPTSSPASKHVSQRPAVHDIAGRG